MRNFNPPTDNGAELLVAIRPPTPMARRAVLRAGLSGRAAARARGAIAKAEHDDHAEAGAERAVGQLDSRQRGLLEVLRSLRLALAKGRRIFCSAISKTGRALAIDTVPSQDLRLLARLPQSGQPALPSMPLALHAWLPQTCSFEPAQHVAGNTGAAVATKSNSRCMTELRSS
jgi:hypothetical protein